MDSIQQTRKQLFDTYREGLADLEEKRLVRLPIIPGHCQCNYHMFYILLSDQEIRDALIHYLREREIYSVFHYVPLHTSPMGRTFGYEGGELPITEEYSNRLLRLPFFHDLQDSDQRMVIDAIANFFTG